MKNILFLLLIVGIFSQCKEKQAGHQTTSATTQELSDSQLLDSVQYYHFQYFWKGAEENSGLAKERIHMDNIYPQNDQDVVTTGGSGFGLMAILVGVKRGFITREEAIQRFLKNVTFLDKVERFHGAWSHWINGKTGKVVPFGKYDDGGDLVETAYLIQGLLAVREFAKQGSSNDEKALVDKINQLWEGVEWDWYTQKKDVIYWHWSKNYGWKMNFAVTGYNECLILYILAASSPTHPVKASVYHKGWARGGAIVSDKKAYNIPLILSHNYAEDYGGPLFWAHYSYLGVNPHKLKDQYANYWDLNINQAKINRLYCVSNPHHFKGYGENCWGLTSSYSIDQRIKDKDSLLHYVGYAGHAPVLHDLGVISPTAALSSIPYLPKEVMQVIRHFYGDMRGKLLGEYGFYDAFSEDCDWFPQKYLAIDQGPIPVMIENYRSGFIWDLISTTTEVKKGLQQLGFESSSF